MAVIELGRERARYSNDEMDGRLRFSSVMDVDFLCMTARPPPRPVRRGLAV